jgi:hypothetical protein
MREDKPEDKNRSRGGQNLVPDRAALRKSPIGDGSTGKSAPVANNESSPHESRTSGCQSDVQIGVDAPAIIEQILGLEVPMTVREALATSKEI